MGAARVALQSKGRRGFRHAVLRGGAPMGQLGLPEILIIAAVALVVFGPARLPELGRSVGRALREFRAALRSTPEEPVAVSPQAGGPTLEATGEAEPGVRKEPDPTSDGGQRSG